jgi:2-keto-4-pentenoate hydratase
MTINQERGQALATARRDGVPLAELPGGLPADEAEAYAIQAEAIAVYESKPSGYKVGATSPFAQEMLGTNHPFTAPMFADSCHEDGLALDVPAYGLIGIEAEFAFRLATDLPPRQAPYTLDDVTAAVATVHPAFEIVGLRVPTEHLANILVVIADFGVNVGFVHGDGINDWTQHDLSSVNVRVDIDGAEVAHGSGAAVLGNPVNALLWTANNRRESGDGLVAGDWISTGATCGIIRITSGQTAVGDFGVLGTVTMSLSSD